MEMCESDQSKLWIYYHLPQQHSREQPQSRSTRSKQSSQQAVHCSSHLHAWLCSPPGCQAEQDPANRASGLVCDIEPIVEATLHTLDDTALPSANWVLDLLDESNNLEEVAGIKVTQADITAFQYKVAKPFVAHLKENISCSFSSSSDIVSAFSIFDPRKVPATDSPNLPQYGKHEIATLLSHYGAAKPAETIALLGESISKEAIITSDTVTEWKTYTTSYWSTSLKVPYSL